MGMTCIFPMCLNTKLWVQNSGISLKCLKTKLVWISDTPCMSLYAQTTNEGERTDNSCNRWFLVVASWRVSDISSKEDDRFTKDLWSDAWHQD